MMWSHFVCFDIVVGKVSLNGEGAPSAQAVAVEMV